MVRESTAALRVSPSAPSAVPRVPCAMSRRRRRGVIGGFQLLAALALLVQHGRAAARISDDDALLGSDLGDLNEVRDNRVRPDINRGDRDESELLLVHVLFRHGDRTPDSPTYPNDPYANYSYYPVGWGSLTAPGKRTEYCVGKFLRKRYGSFVGAYRSGLLAARTTDWPRTKDSMALVLAGFFPPGAQESWADDTDGLGKVWMPIAADAIPRDEDKLLYMWDVPCPAYENAYNEVLASPSFQKQFRGGNNAPLVSYLEKYSGSKISSPEDVYNIYQALLAQNGWNLTLPSWTSEVFPDKMKPLTSLYFELDSYTRKMQRLRAGPLLKRILRHSVAKHRGLLRPEERKIYLYSAHDNNVSALLRALQVWEPLSVPPYGTTVIFEVRKRAGHVGIQMFLRNTTHSEEPHPLTMPDCDHFCPLHRFVQLTSDVIPDNWDEECKDDGA